MTKTITERRAELEEQLTARLAERRAMFALLLGATSHREKLLGEYLTGKGCLDELNDATARRVKLGQRITQSEEECRAIAGELSGLLERLSVADDGGTPNQF
ncbi:MAG: hypothetical protein ACRC2Y_04950 [Aeromonas veronii]